MTEYYLEGIRDRVRDIDVNLDLFVKDDVSAIRDDVYRIASKLLFIQLWVVVIVIAVIVGIGVTSYVIETARDNQHEDMIELMSLVEALVESSEDKLDVPETITTEEFEEVLTVYLKDHSLADVRDSLSKVE